MTKKYDPPQYWDGRLQNDQSLASVGFKGYSAKYNYWNYRAEERALARLLVRAGIDVSGRSVLDVGSGNGYWLDWYATRGGGGITALELSPSAVRRLRAKYPLVRVVEVDIGGEIPELAPADLVNVQSVLFHIVDSAPFERALENLSRLVAPGGWLVLSDRLGCEEVSLAPHCRFRSLGTYERALAGAGFRIEAVEPIHVMLNGGLGESFRWVHWRIARLIRRVEETFTPVLYAMDGLACIGRWANKRMLLARQR